MFCAQRQLVRYVEHGYRALSVIGEFRRTIFEQNLIGVAHDVHRTVFCARQRRPLTFVNFARPWRHQAVVADLIFRSNVRRKHDVSSRFAIRRRDIFDVLMVKFVEFVWLADVTFHQLLDVAAELVSGYFDPFFSGSVF